MDGSSANEADANEADANEANDDANDETDDDANDEADGAANRILIDGDNLHQLILNQMPGEVFPHHN